MKKSITKSSKAHRQLVARIMRSTMKNVANLAKEAGAPPPTWSRSTRDFVRRNA